MAMTIATGVVFPRLEYGKFCSSAEGPIDSGEEHHILGYSSSFPQELISRCTPKTFSLGESPQETEFEKLLTANRRNGLVIRPIRYHGRFCRIAYLIGIRSEGGQQETRFYTAARYLFDSAGVSSPYQIYRSIGRLEGIGRHEKIGAVCPFTELPSLQVVSENPSFLRGALVTIMSGLPLELEAAAMEEFFQLADCVWTHLPADLQPLFSAGWNVSSSLANTLSLSFSPRANSPNARYNIRDRKWQQRPTDRTSDLSGRQYMEKRLGNKPVDILDIINRVGSELPDRTLDLQATAEVQLPDTPGFQDSATRRYFRSFGEFNFTEQLFEVVWDWLRGADIPWHNKLPQAIYRIRRVHGLFAHLLDLIRTPALDEISRQRVDEVAHICLAMDLRVFDSPEWSGCTRLRLYGALAKGDGASALEHYTELAKEDKASELELQVLDKLGRLIPQTFGPDCIRFHDWLLGRDATYDKWLLPLAEQAATEWIPQSAVEIPGLLKRLDALGDHSSKLKIGVFAALASGGPPTQSELAGILLTFPWSARAAMARRLEQRWRETCDVENLLGPESDIVAQWAQYFSPEFFHDLLLRAVAGEELGDIEQIRRFTRSGRDPQQAPFLQKTLARQLINFSPHATDKIKEHWKEFAGLLALWPKNVFNVFFGFLDVEPIQGTAEISESELPLKAELISTFWRIWREQDEGITRSTALNSICEWSARMTRGPDDPPLLRALQIILDGNWDQGVPIPWQETADAIEMIGVAGVKMSNAGKLWRSAITPWQCLFVLRMAPDESHDMETKHWGLLASRRLELLELIEQTPICRVMQEKLRPLMLDFYRPKSTSNLPPWKQEYESTPLWAAFGRLPNDERTFLQGLNAYAASEHRKAECCHLFLECHQVDDHRWRRSRALVANCFVAGCVDKIPRDYREAFWDTLAGFGYYGNFRRESYSLRLSTEGSISGGVRVAGPNLFDIESWLLTLLFDLSISFKGLKALKVQLEGKHWL